MNWQAIFAGIAIAGALVNVFLNLSIKATMLENNEKILKAVDEKYMPRELHESYQEAIIGRVEKLEEARHA